MPDILQLAIVGALVSLLVQFIKNTLGFSSTWTIVAAVALSLISGGVWYTVKDNAAFLTAAGQILLFANAVYGFVISRFEK
jgi:hypothetical protein